MTSTSKKMNLVKVVFDYWSLGCRQSMRSDAEMGPLKSCKYLHKRALLFFALDIKYDLFLVDGGN